MRNLTFAAVLATLLLVPLSRYAAAASDGGLLIVSSNVGTYEVGSILDQDSMVKVDKDESIVMIRGDGRKVAVQGPFEGTAADVVSASKDASTEGGQGGNKAGLLPHGGILASLSNLFSGFESPVLTRSFAGGAMPSPWHLDISRNGKACFRAEQIVQLWRPRNVQVKELALSNMGTGEQAAVRWPGTDQTLQWPVELRVEDGANYRVALLPGSDVKTVSMVIVPDGFPTRMHEAAWMSDNGCDPQARQLVLTGEIDMFINELSEAGKL